MQSKLSAVLALILSFFMVSESWAIGAAFIGNEVPSARAAGQGYVGVAGQNEDPTAVFSNPGAITSLKGTQATLGLHWENIHGSYEDNAGNTTKEKVVDVAVPNLSITQSFMDGKLAAGLSSQSPFGLETNWDSNSPMRYQATVSRLGMVDIMPAVAYQVLPQVSLGGGPDYVNVFRAQLDKDINNDFVNLAIFKLTGQGAPTSGSPDATSSLRGTGANWGYHAGAVYTPNQQNAFGVTYHSKVNVRINGDISLNGITGPVAQSIFGGSSYSTSAYTDLLFPSNIQLGYAFKPTDKWHFEADAAWYHWSETKDLRVRFPSATAAQQGLLGNSGNDYVSQLNLRDCWSFNTGVNYKVSEKWQVRGGFWYEPYATPEAAFTPGFVDLSRYGLSTGFGYAFTPSIGLDAAYTAVFFHNRSINNTTGTASTGIPVGGVPALGIPDPNANGTYKDFANLVALNVTYRFGGK